MRDSILQSFLDNQFLNTDETSHIDGLKKASVAVQKLLLLKKNRHRIIAFTLVALDPTISDDNSIVIEVEGIIIKQWPAFRNSVVKTKDKPISYIQAVILEALNKLSKDINLAAIVWHTGCNVMSHYKLAGQEDVLTGFLLEIGRNVEAAARDGWGIVENAQIDSITPIELTVPKIGQGKVSEDKLKGHLLAAAVHSAWAPQAGGGENPHSQAQNNVNWPKFFAERTAQGLSKEINAAFLLQNKSLVSVSSSIQKSIDTYFSNLKPHLEQVSSSILQSSQSLNKRSDLLWWKQALYSPKLDVGYRKLDPLILAIVMAVDLADSVSSVYPKSVDYFLEETLRDVLGDEVGKDVVLTELLEKLKQCSDAEKSLLERLQDKGENRKPLGVCVSSVLKGEMTTDEVFKCTGIEKNVKISLGELTVWLFHDLQANTLVNMK